jgi:hypothetical protein
MYLIHDIWDLFKNKNIIIDFLDKKLKDWGFKNVPNLILDKFEYDKFECMQVNLESMFLKALNKLNK